jgi:hypothetical protein
MDHKTATWERMNARAICSQMPLPPVAPVMGFVTIDEPVGPA